MKKAFTLAEILIVLVIIGILTAILLPIAFQSSPDEYVMKFKKGYNILNTVIRELVSSDKYYQDGDLGIRANGNLIDKKHEGDITYFCESIADVMSNTKSVNCSQDNSKGSGWLDVEFNENEGIDFNKERVDTLCKNQETKIGAEIIAGDGIIYYNGYPGITFGIQTTEARTLRSEEEDYFEEQVDSSRQFGSHKNKSGFDRIYKVFCMDIDGISKGEDPFGFGIRADGKILTGKRADEWMNKTIQKND